MFKDRKGSNAPSSYLSTIADAGRAHSHAVVLSDRIDLFSIQTMIQAHDDCPPEAQGNQCTLWFGPRQLEPEERIFVRHGHSLRFFIQRMTVAAPASVSSTNLQERMDALSAGPPLTHVQQYLLTAPFWFQALHRIFVDVAATERQDEGPVAYVNTWYLHGVHYPRCQTARTVRIRDDPMTWQRTILETWGDRLSSNLPTSFYWVSPAPATSLQDGTIGHILLVQELPEDRAAALLSARVRDHAGQALNRVAVCVPSASSAETSVASFPVPGPFLRFPRRVGRGQFFFDPNVHALVQSGDGIVIDIMDNTHLERPAQNHAEGMSLLQTQINLFATMPRPISIEQAFADDLRDAPCGTPMNGSCHQQIRLSATDIVRSWDQYDQAFWVPQFFMGSEFDDHPWLHLWWDSQLPVSAICIYHEGSHSEHGAGAAAVAFLWQPGRGWTFGGALTLALPPSIDFYGAELRGSLLALHFGIDLLKIIALIQTEPPTLSFRHDKTISL